MSLLALAGAVKAPHPIRVRIPDFGPYTVGRLLDKPNSNPKLAKSNNHADDVGYFTRGLALAPADESGYQMCASSTPGCRAACLYHQGRGQCASISRARIAKTIAFMENRPWFETRLRFELEGAVRHASQAGCLLAFRPNVLSDFPWENTFPWMFEDYPLVQFYDYTKHFKRMLAWCARKLPPNYHLTFSRSESNERECVKVLNAGGNVAVVFRDPALPATWNGYFVMNGDEDDLRFLDPDGVVIGLKAKGSARHDTSGFVVNLPLV